jgi:hypothetical protein
MDLYKSYRIFNGLLKIEKLNHFKRSFSGYNSVSEREIEIFFFNYFNLENHNTNNSKYFAKK